VKVQYPGVAEAVRADLQNVGAMTRIAKVVSPNLDARAVAAEIRERVLEELDYEHEAHVQRTFARAYRGHPFIHVPEVVTELSRPRVLVSEWVDGAPFEDIRHRPEDERDRFGEIVFRFYLGSMHHLGWYNADPHPGNYVLLADGRGSFLDYGSAKRLDPAWLDKLVPLLMAGAAGDAEGVKESLTEMGYLARPDQIEADRLLESLRETAGWYLVDREVRIDPARVRQAIAAATDPRRGFFDVMRRAKLPPEDVLMRRLDACLVAVLGQLAAGRNWLRIGREWWTADEPSTELGRAELEFWSRSGRSLARPRV
jgi:hypothetical protein